ncbi:MAG: 4-hydroxy-tetrahydrodipicolinate reductase [Bdellovibrionales bacterium]|nr:4-hydroxy-tetrahydrodipicolinate reductase [Bdellovibrionales bacterium]
MKIIISGASGKMGGEIKKLISTESSLQYLGGFGLKENPSEKVVSDPTALPAGASVVIDFSSPDSMMAIAEWCEKNQVPLVSGTTGIQEEHKKFLKKISQKIPVLWAPNTSVGVNFLKKLLSQLQVPAGFDIQITEYHHAQKKDKPSGTALLLEDALKNKNKISEPTLSIRGGGIFGIHRIDLMAGEETISIEHNALSRAVFAKGALTAARWLTQQSPGLYSMEDVL